MSLQKFKNRFLDATLDFLWNAWTGFGVYGTSERRIKNVLDPESLLLFTLYFSVYDQRLMDEVIDWLVNNAQWLNYPRLGKIYSSGWREVTPQLQAIGDIVDRYPPSNRWKLKTDRLSAATPGKTLAFLSKTGDALPVSTKPDPVFSKYGFTRGEPVLRGMSRDARVDGWPDLIFRLRSLFGINSRAEIMAYLLAVGHGYASDIAWKIDYSQKTVQDTLVEMVNSKAVSRLRSGKTHVYKLNASEKWYGLLELALDEKPDSWARWKQILWELRIIWNAIRNKEDGQEYLVFSAVKDHLRQAVEALLRPNLELSFIYSSEYAGEESTRLLLDNIEQFYRKVYATE